MAHPLLPWLLRAAHGQFPPVDGLVTLMPPLDQGFEAVVSFTGHSCLATRWTAADLADLAPDGFGTALQPHLLLRLAGDGTVGVIDATLVSTGTGVGGPPRTNQWDDHPRVGHARALRTHVRVHGDEQGFITIAEGLAGRTELSIQTIDDTHDTRFGRSLIASALGLAPAGHPVFAAVAPGNARSMRAFLSQGFRVIGSEVLIQPG